jgi:transposase
MAKYWTGEEEIVLKSMWNSHTISEIADKLGRSYSSIEKKGSRLSLGPKKLWSEAEEKYLAEHAKSKTFTEIGVDLGKTSRAVQSKASSMGIKSFNRWTKEDEIELEGLWGSYSLHALSKRFNRSPEALQSKAYKLGLGGASCAGDRLTAYYVASEMGVDYHTLFRWKKNCQFPVMRKVYKKRVSHVIEIHRLFTWLQENQDLWDSRRISEGSLGPEPPWFSVKRRRDLEKNTAIFSSWTVKEDRTAKLLYESGLPCPRIAERIGRSELAVRRRMQRIGARRPQMMNIV